MQILLSFDYEIFFGTNSGTVQKSIIEPTIELTKIADKHNVKLSFFVDCGHLIKLHEFKGKYKQLHTDYINIFKNLDYLSKNNHDLQLHIHPHWQNTYFDGERWIFDTKKLRLHSFDKIEIQEIFDEYTNVLKFFSDDIFSFRAGGWNLQPFEKLRQAMMSNNIWLDSSVFPNGYFVSDFQYIDYKNAPEKTLWQFENDPVKEKSNGFFTEVPIASVYHNPSYYYKLAYRKKFDKKYAILGDGEPIYKGKTDVMKLLMMGGNNVVSTDTVKADYLLSDFNRFKKNYKEDDYFVTIGHPKSTSQASLESIDKFITATKNQHSFVTYKDIKSQLHK